jgi:hypothetical protein
MWRMTWYSSWMPLPPCMSRARRAMSSALPQLLRLIEADHLRRGALLVQQPADAQHGLQAERDLGLHVGQLLLDQLVLRQRPPNCWRSSVYWRAACQQNSAAPRAPQAMP